MRHLVTGGARSGKSTYALEQALQLAPSGPIGFIATATPMDGDMADRIRRHQAERDERFLTLEAPLDIAGALLDPRPRAFIVDCLTLWCSNLLFAGSTGHFLDTKPDAELFGRHVDALEQAVAACDRPVILVTNEVGLGIVPPDAVTRTYRDWLGRLNQRVARASDRVTLLVSGIPVVIKPGTR